MTNNVTYMTWQAMSENGQQKRVAIPTTVLASVEETVTSATITITRAIAAASLLSVATTTSVSVHFYM